MSAVEDRIEQRYSDSDLAERVHVFQLGPMCGATDWKHHDCFSEYSSDTVVYPETDHCPRCFRPICPECADAVKAFWEGL